MVAVQEQMYSARYCNRSNIYLKVFTLVQKEMSVQLVHFIILFLRIKKEYKCIEKDTLFLQSIGITLPSQAVGTLYLGRMIGHSENKILRSSKTRLYLEFSSPVFNNHVSCKNVERPRQNQNTLSGLSFVPLAFFQHACLFNGGLEHSRSDRVFKQSRLNLISSPAFTLRKT